MLTEPGSTTTLDQALEVAAGGPDALHRRGLRGGPRRQRPRRRCRPDQLAYIYFTSGSTGEPKGAMCEHAGMLNHLYAKIDDLEIGEGQVVAQTAPQCFDISLWQLVSALLVGGRTLIVEQEVILDVQRFVDTIVDGRVDVLQVVPSYLEVVLSYLEQHPRELPDLRCVSVTGEALKKELAQRWFACPAGDQAGQRLRADRDLGRHQPRGDGPACPTPTGSRSAAPVNNVHVYVVDEHLAPVPLGAPGEIVFSGVCVGRGYINDPERTRAAFLTDPHREGERLYRSGDHGRWRPDGKLEFLGRRDYQVKIRGFRIEIGEIENTLLRVPGVRDGAVVVAERADQSKHLVAFYSGPQPLDDRRRCGTGWLSRCPSTWSRRPSTGGSSLPLTANSKIDKKALTGWPESSTSSRTTTTLHVRRPSSGWRPRGRRCSAFRRTRSAGGTTSSTAAAPRCRR